MAPKARTTPRKTPKQARSRATIGAILDATARVLVREGFDRASTNRIAEVAGVSVGSLYQYFPSKEALVAALVERHMDEMMAEFSSAMAQVAQAPLEEAVRTMVALMLRAHAVDPALHRVLIEQVPRVGRLGHIHRLEGRVREAVKVWLCAHAGEVREVDVDLAAFVAVTAVEALTHAAVLYEPARLREPALAEEIVQLIARYLRRR